MNSLSGAQSKKMGAVTQSGFTLDQAQTERPGILFLTHRLDIGGIERQIVELLKGFKTLNRFRLILGVLDHGGELDSEAGKYVDSLLSVRKKNRFDITVLIHLIRQARSENVRLIQTFDWMAGLAGWVTARYLNIPIVNSGIQSALPQLPLREKINGWCARHADAIIGNSYAGLKAYGFSYRARARVIYNGIDLARFENVSPFLFDGPTICMVANFSQYKDHITVIQAGALLRETYPSVKFVMVGKDLGTLQTCRALVQELELASCLTFVTDAVHPEPYISGADVCVLTSTQGEGTSNAILEYMALSKPVVATVCDGNRELVCHGTTGFLVDAFSAQALADRIQELLSHPERAYQMGACGCKRILENYTLERMIVAHEALFETLLSGNRKNCQAV